MYNYYSPAETRGIKNRHRISITATHEDGILKISVARTSKGDAFIRKKGRMISEGRLKGGRIFKSIAIEECDGKKFLEIVVPLAEELSEKGINQAL